MKIAFLGLGAMGSRMAMTIVKAGHEVTVWNRSAGKADALVEAGAREVGTPREAAAGAQIVVSMVMDDAASETVWTDADTGALPAMDDGAVAVECSTISLDWCRTLAKQAADRGIAFVDAPVAGTLPPAESGDLVIIAGGDAAAINQAAPAFDAMGKATHHAGPSGSGSAVKLVVNGMLALQEAGLAEMLGLAKRAGIDHGRAFEILCETPIASPMLKTYGQLMVDGTDDVNFPVAGLLKDLGLIEKAAAANGADVRIQSAVRAAFDDAAAAGLADRNQTEIMRRYD